MSLRRMVDVGLPPIVFGVAFLVAWEAIVQGFDLKPYFLPAPSAIWEAFVDNASLVRKASFASGANALVGLLAGTALGSSCSDFTMP